jgi:2-iminoacetate synthase
MPSALNQTASLTTLIDVLDSDENQFKAFYSQAAAITDEIFGKKRTLFNPIYVSNICLADCSYCGYRVSNKGLPRKTLSPTEVAEEARFLRARGIEDILVLAGDYKHDSYMEMLLGNIRAINEAVCLRWLGVEVATLETHEYQKLRDARVSSVTVFQETYDRLRYGKLHNTPQYKADFDFRYNAQERAIRAGIKEVGLGVLYGVGSWRADTIAMAEHAAAIQNGYPSAKLRFSFPRLQRSTGQSADCQTEAVSEAQLLRAIVGVRLSFPDSSLVLTGRESIQFLTDHASVVDVLGYGGATSVGGYTVDKNGLQQFTLNSKDTFNRFISTLRDKGYATPT